MTTIRKIVTSKIDGDNANNTSTSEIRPFGEAAFYQNTSEGNGGPDKLELLIFDGVRTHLKSKVLAKGRFYGGDADSGDGSGLDTIKLIPDAALHYNEGQFSNDQYLVVDPTAPNHIHLRAGGTIDQSNADLFLGGERNHVRVSDSYDNVQITTDAGEGTYTWTFDNSGQLLIPGGSNGRITEDEPGVVVYSDTGFAVQTNAGSPVSSYQVEFIGFIDDGFGMGVAGATLHVTQMIAGTITDGMTIYGNGLAPEGWTLTFGSAFEPVGAGGTGYYTLNGANYLTPSQSFNNNVPDPNGPKNWIFGTDGVLSFPDGSFQSTAANLDQLEIDGRTILTTVDDAIVVQTSIHPTMTAEAIIGSSLDLLVVDISANDDITVVGAGWEINSGSEQAPTWLPVVSTDVVPGEICSINVPGFEFIAGFTYTFRNTNEDTYQWTFNPNGTLIGPQGSIFSNETSALPKREYFTDKVANYYWDGVSTLYVATAGDTIPAFLLTEEIEGEINQLSPATNNLTLRMTDGDGNSIVGVCSRPTSINNSFSYSQLGGVPGLEFFLVVEWTSSALPAINTLTPLQRFSVDQGTYRDLNIELLEPHGQFEQRLVFRNDGSLEIPEQIQLGNILISSTQNGLTINSSGKIWTFDTNGHLNVPNEIASDQTMLGIRSNTGARLQYQDPLPPNTPGVLNQALVTVDPSGIKLETKSSDGSDPIGSIAAWAFDVDGNLTFPDATIQATAWTGSYSPATPSDWDGTPPVSIAEAIDRLAARVKLIGGGVGA